MSATNRGALRRDSDFYETPTWCVWALLNSIEPPLGLWLEPAVGNGKIIEAVNTYYHNEVNILKDKKLSWKALDINQPTLPLPSNTEFEQGTYLDYKWPSDEPISVIITNPPYSLAEEFVRKSLECEGAIVAMLLRLNFLGSRKRTLFLEKHTPSIYVLSKRPSFTGEGTDATEYAWMVWWPDKRKTVNILNCYTIF